MLLSIDRVLQLLGEGKSLEKIASLASSEVSDVVDVIERARGILARYEKPASRKKIILKKKKNDEDSQDQLPKNIAILMENAQLSAFPQGQRFQVQIAVEKSEREGLAGIGILIIGEDSHQVGRISAFLSGIEEESDEGYFLWGIEQSLDLMAHLGLSSIQLQISNDHIFKEYSGEVRITNEIRESRLDALKKKVRSLQAEVAYMPRHRNEKAFALAREALERKKV